MLLKFAKFEPIVPRLLRRCSSALEELGNSHFTGSNADPLLHITSWVWPLSARLR